MQETLNEPTAPDNGAAELVSLAKGIASWQAEQSPRISNEGMLKRYPGLGSVKTYTRLQNGDTTSLDIERGDWLRDYREILGQAQVAALGVGDDPIYSDLTPAREIAAAIKDLAASRGTDRILIIQGGTGAGKTKALECAHALIANSVLITADVMWGLSNSAFLGDLCKGLGAVTQKDEEDFDKRISCTYRAALLKRALGAKRRVILIDEAHHLSADGIDFLKGLINAFKGIYIVLAGMDTLWNRLTADRWQQAKQIIFNRGRSTLQLDPPSVDDVLTFLHRRVPGFDMPGSEPAIGELVAEARQFGSFAFLRRVASKMLKAGGEPDGDALRRAIAKAKKDVQTGRRGQTQAA